LTNVDHVTDDEEGEKMTALAQYENIDVLEVVQTTYCNDLFTACGREYLVLTDEEADDAWEEYLDNYIDEYVLPEMPDHLRRYFDEEAFKDDAKMDSRGHSLSRYDGCEYDVEINGTTYYLYRQ
jgi:hypothetical protein